jgi:hypothetical protein
MQQSISVIATGGKDDEVAAAPTRVSASCSPERHVYTMADPWIGFRLNGIGSLSKKQFSFIEL